MQKLLVFSALILTICFTSCQVENSSDVNQNRIFTHYELFYNANEDITYARAWFRFGNATGTLVDLTSPSEVNFGRETLAFVKLLGYYEKKMAGYKASGTFHWEDTEGNAFDNAVTIHPIAFGSLADSVARTAAFDIPWTGDALGNDEVVGVWINGENEGDAQAALTFEMGASSIIVPADKMAKIGAGPGKIYMDRRNSPEITDVTGAGGTAAGVYRAKTLDIVFK